MAPMRVTSALLPALLLGCGGPGAPSNPAPPASAPAPSASAEPLPVASAAAPVRARKPFEVFNACTDVTTVVFGDDPKAASANKRTIAPSGQADGPRDGDGNQTVWLLDGLGEPLVKVRVTRGMKRVEVGRSCRTLDAR